MEWHYVDVDAWRYPCLTVSPGAILTCFVKNHAISYWYEAKMELCVVESQGFVMLGFLVELRIH